MRIKYWAGYITTAIIDQIAITDWVMAWGKRCKQAEARGNELIVFEIKKEDLLPVVAELEQLLQKHYDTGVIEETMPDDLMMLKAFLTSLKK